MTEPSWGGIRVEVWGTDASQLPRIEQFGEAVEAAIDRARFRSRTEICRQVVVLAEGSRLEVARFIGRWALDNPEGLAV